MLFFGHIGITPGGRSAWTIKSDYHNLYTYQAEIIGIIILLALFARYYKLYVPDNIKEFILHRALKKDHLSILLAYR